MTYNVDFELCSAIFLVILAFISWTKRRLIGYQSSVFRMFLFLALANNVLDVITTYCIPYYNTMPAWISWGLNGLYLASQMCIPVFFVMYIYRKLTNVTPVEKRLISACLLPATIGALLALTSPLHHLIFYIDEAGYHHGSVHIYLYTNFVFYVIMAIYLSIRWRRQMERNEFPLLFPMIVVAIIPVVVQFFIPTVMLSGVGAALSVYIMYFVSENQVSLVDAVTGVLNRQAMVISLGNDLGEDDKTQIYAIAPDNFKLVNEMYGLEGGNAVLCQITHSMQQEFGEKKVFRFGGDTFVILVETQDDHDVKNRIYNLIGQDFHVGEAVVHLSACVALVHAANHAEGELVSAIEYAIAEAKARGKGQFFEVEEKAAGQMARKKAIEQTMMQNIREGHFEVHYQLIYDIRKDGFYSMEALARLNVPDYGYVSPEEFIKIAEKNGSITQLGMIVLEECCRFIKEVDLRDLGIDFIEVNLSMVQCMQPDIHRDVLRIMQRYEVPTHMINFEVTESVAASSEELLIRNMERFTEQRIHLSLDDYGSGYSNINYLVDLPFSIVKIDKYVVWAAMKNETSRIILENTIRTFKGIGLRVVAEGVEDQAMVDMIVGMGADYIQGFFYAKPVPKDKIVERLKQEMTMKEI